MQEERIRIYDSHREYFRFSSKNKHINEINDKKVKVTKYLTKRVKDKEYYNGRLILPSKFCQTNKILNQRFRLIGLGRTHFINKTKDLWGHSYLLFIFGFVSHIENSITIDTNKPQFSKIRKNYSRIHKHSRNANGKKYHAGKIYVPHKLIGKHIHFIKLKIPIKLKYGDDGKDYGLGYILFYEDYAAKNLKVSYKKIKDVLSHKATLILLGKGKTIKEIIEIRNLRPTSVWSHVARAFKRKEISQTILKEIIVNNCHEDVRNNVVVFIEIMRNELYKEEKRLQNYSPSVKRPHYLNKTRNEIKELFYQQSGKYLPVNMLEVITLYLNSLYD